MGQPVVHFEVIGKDGGKLRKYYSELFDWEIDSNNEMNYGMVARDSNQAADGNLGIGGGLARGASRGEGHLTLSFAVPAVEAAPAQAQRLRGTRGNAPREKQIHQVH